MKRFFKRFAAHSDYETFKSSAEYIMPNISVCDDDKLNVHYNPIPPLINFNIDDESYQALEGMTWGDWVNSKYNINNIYSINNDNIWDYKGYNYYGIVSYASGMSYVNILDVIIAQKYLCIYHTNDSHSGGTCD